MHAEWKLQTNKQKAEQNGHYFSDPLEMGGYGANTATKIKIEEYRESQPCEAKVHNQKPHGNQYELRKT